VPGKIRPEAVWGIQAESGGELLWDLLDGFDFPVLVIKGAKEDSLLKKEDLDLYAKHLKHGYLILLEESGHDVWKPDLGRFIETLNGFMGTIDTARSVCTH
jgi:hypothetical protein